MKKFNQFPNVHCPIALTASGEASVLVGIFFYDIV